ncbi:MAG: leucine-rich repeat protein [Lachnospira sp.]|nr:leucine-rich repeat protein [Lachnospira sp.]
MIQVHTTTNQIPKKAYLGNRELIEIMVPYGTTELSDWAFAGCKNLELVLLPDTIQRLGKDVFLNCNHLKRILLFDKAQESVFKEGLLPLWNTKDSIQGELFMQAVCRLMMPDAVTLFLKDRKQFFVDIGEQIASYLARPDEEGFAPFLAGGEEDYDDKESDISYYCQRRRLNKIFLLGRFFLLADICPQEYKVEGQSKKQWVAYMKKQKETYQVLYEEQHLVKELFLLYEKLDLWDKTIVSELLEQVTAQQVELRALLLRKQEEYLQIESGWEQFEL